MNQFLNEVVYYVLIVDDEKDDHYFIRKAINTLLPQAIVESLYDGTEALDYLSQCTNVPNLILLDLKMKNISGKDTLAVIRQNESLKQIPVMILTGIGGGQEKEKLMDMGADGYYVKPGDMSKIDSVIGEIFDKWLKY